MAKLEETPQSIKVFLETLVNIFILWKTMGFLNSMETPKQRNEKINWSI